MIGRSILNRRGTRDSVFIASGHSRNGGSLHSTREQVSAFHASSLHGRGHLLRCRSEIECLMPQNSVGQMRDVFGGAGAQRLESGILYLDLRCVRFSVLEHPAVKVIADTVTHWTLQRLIWPGDVTVDGHGHVARHCWHSVKLLGSRRLQMKHITRPSSRPHGMGMAITDTR